MAVVVTQVTAVVMVAVTVAAVVLIAVRHVSLMVTAPRVHRTVTRLALTRTHAPMRPPALTSRQALTPVALSSQHVHPMVATMAAITMIAHHAQVVMLAMLETAAAILVAVKIVVQRLLIGVARIHASVRHALILRRVRTKVVTVTIRVVLSAVIVHMQALPLVMATAMIVRHALSVIAIRVRSLIVRHAPILIVQIAVIVSHARLARQRHAANTRHVHAPSARTPSIATSVLNAPNTRHVQRVRLSTRPARRASLNAPLVLRQRRRLTVVIVPHVAPPSRPNTRLRKRGRAANNRRPLAWLYCQASSKGGHCSPFLHSAKRR